MTMRLLLMIVGGLVLANIVIATFFVSPLPPRTYVTVNDATKQGLDPWMANEKYGAPARAWLHQSMLDDLSKPWSEFCNPDGHKKLVAGIDGYYYQREAEISTYAKVYGEAARQFAIKNWQTTDDLHIQQWMSGMYERGFFTLQELKDYSRAPFSELVKNTKVTTKACAT